MPDLYRSPIPPQLWDRIREEYGLPTLEQVRERLTAVSQNPEPVMRRLVRVFIHDQGTYRPGYQFQPDLTLNPVVTGLFDRAMELRIPHNYLALWMMTPCPALDGSRPVDRLKPGDRAALHAALESTLARAVA
ncbi:antitoxin Xre/MbcA/ParS toxin-binding domain-containing protein [Paenarthrobacter nitroguajacolicus]|uniref:antitoxin Xre/MbcA/ParS toxin-binding domain-containing protein n=1 Tax=Paenarthrobacter nitroguajacolicus TaxID=211146 RepID=UPI00248BE390|nr:antitoxin Xre/MbcA/ParS toxin-binding domain-containing protein [Paenarthrobacter nitroguajacolicus]MDI2036830.1 hypothetical protein [Paenarthrobacter nitroguajacolicus]